MCGIAGIVGGTKERRREAVERMVRALAHRGPDASGIVEFDGATLGHTRLAIVDLAGGAQPMTSALDPGLAVTFNGEIYGYRELRPHYGGYPFRTTSDTELLLAMYHVHGASFVEKLPGMFAFGIWDQAARSLFLARDRFGEKPLYFAGFEEHGEFGLLFASELKAVLASGLIVPQLDRGALAHYLQYLYVHPSHTIYKNVHALMAGAALTWRDRAASVAPYWRLPACSSARPADAVETVRALFRQSVRRQLVADVPVGAFLSGGLDSSTVVAAAAGMKPGIETFSFRFRGATGAADESGHARAVAEKYGTRHHVLEDSDADIAGLLQEMAKVYDEPFADSSNIAMWLISRQARQRLKVVLTGDGGDELLGGYPWYRALMLQAEGPSFVDRRLRQNQFFSDATLEKFGLKPFHDAKRIRGRGTIDDAFRMDLLDYMPGDILVKIDRASMAHGLELRAPFLDAELAGFLIALPPETKIGPAGDKLIFREAFADMWPDALRTRGKQGFGAPVAEWLARPQVKDLIDTRLCERSHPLFSLLPFDATRVAVERRNFQTWSLLVLALWLERHPL